MQKRNTLKAEAADSNPFQLRRSEEVTLETEPLVHVYGNGVVCNTDSRGHSTPRARNPAKLVLDASEGFIPLWAKGTTLRWRFQERSMKFFKNPDTARTAIEDLMSEALLAWGDARPVSFAKRDDAWDFEVVMSQTDDCRDGGCVLASAFFPDAGRHELVLYPKLFKQSRKGQVDTLIHEFGHIFGLRHFFAKVEETEWPSEVFGTHRPFTIMNYGHESQLTAEDKTDLKQLYQAVWSGQLAKVNGTPIRLVQPFHTVGIPPQNMVAVNQLQTGFQPQLRAPSTRNRSTVSTP